MKRLVLALALTLPVLGQNYVHGLGNSTLTCLDVDGDGYGVGPSCTGPDADDFDATVNTAAQGIAKYGSLTAFITHLGYTTSGKFWCMSPSGNNSTGAANIDAATACANPYLNYDGTPSNVYANISPGDIVLMRANYNDSIGFRNQGTSGSPIVFLAYPGEQPLFDKNALANAGMNVVGVSNLTFDGGKFVNGAGIGGAGSANVLIRHVEGIGCCGLIATINFFDGLTNLIIEYNVLHDNSYQHGTYNGSRGNPSSGVIYRKNIAYNNSYNGLTFNGRCTGCSFDQNISYNNGTSGISLEEGVSNSFVRSNLLFSNGQGLTIYNYADNCSDGVGGGQGICPYDQTGNLIENNTIYHTGCSVGNGGCSDTSGDAIQVSNSNTCPVSGGIYSCAGTTVCSAVCPASGNIGSNTFRNNILVNYGDNNTYPPIVYSDNAGTNTCGSFCQGYLSTSTWTDLIVYQNDGNNGSGAFRTGLTISTCSAAVSLTTLSGCTNANPAFVSASPSYWNSVSSFDFRLLPSSPGLHAGTPTGQPNYDLVGRAYTTANPSLGSRERNLFAQGWNDLGTKLTASLCPASGASGSVDQDGGAYNYQAFCGNGLTIAWGGAFFVSAPTNPRLCPWNGGHTDYGGNEIYCLNFNLATPTVTLINNPTQISAYDYNNNVPGIPDASFGIPCSVASCAAPSARHSYSLIDYSPSLNKSYLIGGALYGTGHTAPPQLFYDSWSLDWSTSPPTWAPLDPVNCVTGCGAYPTLGSPINPYGDNWFAGSTVYGWQVWDSVRNLNWVFMGSNGIVSHDPSTNIYTGRSTKVSSSLGISAGGTTNAVYDPKRQAIWALGGGNIGILDTSAGGTNASSTLSSLVSGCGTPINSIAPGIGYDSLRDVIYIWPTNGLGTIYQLNLSGFTWSGGVGGGTLTCSTLTTGTGPGTSGTTNGTYGRMAYSDALDAVVLIPGFNEDAFVYSLGTADPGGSGFVSPPPPPPPSKFSSCDLNQDGVVNGVDYQIAVNQATGVAPCTNAALQGNGQCNVIDVQRVAVAARGGACLLGP